MFHIPSLTPIPGFKPNLAPFRDIASDLGSGKHRSDLWPR